jgi:hypothetical protein
VAAGSPSSQHGTGAEDGHAKQSESECSRLGSCNKGIRSNRTFQAEPRRIVISETCACEVDRTRGVQYAPDSGEEHARATVTAGVARTIKARDGGARAVSIEIKDSISGNEAGETDEFQNSTSLV